MTQVSNFYSVIQFKKKVFPILNYKKWFFDEFKYLNEDHVTCNPSAIWKVKGGMKKRQKIYFKFLFVICHK